MWRWAFLVVRPQLSSPNPNFSKPRTTTANSDFWSWLTHQLLVRLKFTNPNLQICLPKMANSEKLRLGIDNPCRIVFLSLRMNKCLERVNGRHFWNPGVFSYAMIPRWRANLKHFFFHRHICSLWSQVPCRGRSSEIDIFAFIRNLLCFLVICAATWMLHCISWEILCLFPFMKESFHCIAEISKQYWDSQKSF
jgi:hypothetical protein